jgi:2-aminoadipate transaminase
VLRIKGNHDFGSTSLLQHLLARVLASGDYERHLAVLARRYARKAALMTSALRAHFPASVSWHEPKGGLYVWVSLPGHVPAGPKSRFFARALDRGVLYVPGELCYAEDPARPRPRHELRLSFGGASDEEIRTGIARLGAVAHEFAARTRASANSSRLRS